MDIFDACHRAQRLGDEIKSGGEGTVYYVENRPKAVAKLYHPEFLGDIQRQSKISAQVNLFYQYPELKNYPIAWPRMAIFNEDNQWIGYVMPKIEGITLSVFRNPKRVEQRLGHIDRVSVLNYIDNLIETIMVLHNKGFYLGDINLDNFLLNPKI